MSHRNAGLTPSGGRIIIERVLAGRTVAHVAKAGSAPTAHMAGTVWGTAAPD